MTTYFCPVPVEEYNRGNNGIAYAAEHRSEWFDGSGIIDYLAAGWVKGCDYFLYNGKCYYLIASYLFPEKEYVVHLGIEDDRGRKNTLTPEQWSNL